MSTVRIPSGVTLLAQGFLANTRHVVTEQSILLEALHNLVKQGGRDISEFNLGQSGDWGCHQSWSIDEARLRDLRLHQSLGLLSILQYANFSLALSTSLATA